MTDESTTRAPKRRRRLGCGCLLAPLALLALAALGVVLARDAIATALLENATEQAGIACTSGIDASIDLSFSEVTIAPTRCELPPGSKIAALSFSTPLVLELDGIRTQRAHTDELVLELRAPPPQVPDARLEESFPGPLGVLAGARGAIVELMRTGAAASARDLGLEDATIGRLVFTHSAMPIAELGGVRSHAVKRALDLHADTVALAGVQLELDAVDAALTPETGRVSADIPLALGFGVARVRRTVRASLTASALDTPSPVVEASLGTEL